MIYFARHLETGYIKIGYTRHIQRVEQRLINEYGSVKLIGAMRGGYQDETHLHSLFANDAVMKLSELPDTGRRRSWGKEWYTATHRLVKYIEANAREDLLQTEESEPGGKLPAAEYQEQKPRKNGKYLLQTEIAGKSIQAETSDETLIRWMEAFSDSHGGISKSVIIRMALEQFRFSQERIAVRDAEFAARRPVDPAPYSDVLDKPTF